MTVNTYCMWVRQANTFLVFLQDEEKVLDSMGGMGGGLLCHGITVHSHLKVKKKDGGRWIGTVCMTYSSIGRSVIFMSAPLPNHNIFRLV